MVFAKLPIGQKFFSDKHSDAGIMMEYEKIGDKKIAEQILCIEIGGFYKTLGNARRITDNMLMEFSQNDPVQVI